MSLEAWDWALSHGAAGVLAVVCLVQFLAIRKLYTQVNQVQEERVADLKSYAEAGEKMQDKVHKTANDLARFADFSQRRGR